MFVMTQSMVISLKQKRKNQRMAATLSTFVNTSSPQWNFCAQVKRAGVFNWNRKVTWNSNAEVLQGGKKAGISLSHGVFSTLDYFYLCFYKNLGMQDELSASWLISRAYHCSANSAPRLPVHFIAWFKGKLFVIFICEAVKPLRQIHN